MKIQPTIVDMYLLILAISFLSCNDRFSNVEDEFHQMTMNYITCSYTDDFLSFLGFIRGCDSYTYLHELSWIQEYKEISDTELSGVGLDSLLSIQETDYYIQLRMINWMKLQSIEIAKEIEMYRKHKNLSPFSERQIRNEERFIESLGRKL